LQQFEFVVVGKPRSVNAKPRSLNKWKQTVGAAATKLWGSAELIIQEQISVFIVYFHKDKTSLDVDNIAKPVIDALKGSIVHDDFIVAQVVCRRTKVTEELIVSSIPDVLAEHFGVTTDFIYIKLTNGPNHSELPQ
jgi:crossover junction endodeoxyribonuclease RusA